jgi:hypothetical protein
MPDTPRLRRVLMSEELFQQLGATKVDWGEQDKYGFYTPTVYRDERAHIDALTAAVRDVMEPMPDIGPSGELIDGPQQQAWVKRQRKARAAVLAILRGEQGDPDAEAEAEFLKPIKP